MLKFLLILIVCVSFITAYETIPAILASRTMVNGKCPDETKNVACGDKCCPLPYVIFYYYF